MLKSLLMSLSKAKWAKRFIIGWKPARLISRRFISGETLSEALEVVRGLNARGIMATLDQLGEDTTTIAEALQAAQGVKDILDGIEKFQLRCNVSVKLSQIGLVVDEELCQKNLEIILEAAKTSNNFVRIDMEGTNLTDRTLQMYKWARKSGYKNVGIVLQAYLYRTSDDLGSIGETDSRVRLCKGAYKEIASLAYPKKQAVDANFDRLTARLIEQSRKFGYPLLSEDGNTPPIPALATHDGERIKIALEQMQVNGIPKGAVEFQMLYGIQREMQDKLTREGYHVRVYVPFGTHWYPFFMRRLAERPANLWFFFSQLLRK